MNDESQPPAWYQQQQAEKRKRNKLILIIAAVLALGLFLGLSVAALMPDSKQDVLTDDQVGGKADSEKWLSQSVCSANSIGPGNTTARVARSAQRGMINVVTGDDGQVYETDDNGRCRVVTERVSAIKTPPRPPVVENSVVYRADYGDTDSDTAMDWEEANPSGDGVPDREIARPTPRAATPAPVESDDPFYEPPTYESQKAKAKEESGSE